ncbi:leukocidin family pore-forming toxin [Vibrio splendidus]|uniref:Cytolysin n=1 Tax=Vibrio splendidus TaxID=29497 RepID=A0A2N7P5H7_VIBSP|nr:leukocidin family pore-forming toxin [Vibrio splendidus]OEF72625.1 cytolysin [Vibrio splendidus 1F-157]PMI50439.1 cytolysin [Vibrio splendidus]PMI83990.1 cytolysin [Vibrio splendidus]PMJ81095.1 cytolysin [Vibrio splendidus]PMO91980.1 cytolysin [Vibrio splendidus]
MSISKIFTLSLLSISVNAFAEDYVPIVEQPYYLVRTGLTCTMHTDEEFTSQRDYCNGGATIDVRVVVSLMRSIQTSTSEGFTPDAKIARFSVSSGSSGTGFHLVDNIQQDHTWFGSWADRRTFIGPFASSYELWVKPTSGYTPKKISDFPNNENKNYQHRDTTGFSIGVDGKVGAEVGDKGPTIKGELSASFSYKAEKTLVFDTKDYRIRNYSSLSDFNIAFEREFSACEELRREELGGCYFTSAHWGSGWVFDKSKFNPISYANFKPNYDVVYEAPVSQTGTTDFEIGAKFVSRVRFGTVLPSPLFSVYGPDGSSYNTRMTKQTVRIDWSHPLFEAESHVSLQSLSNNNLCLDVYGYEKAVGSKVSGYTCTGNWNQNWGLDDKMRYRSRVAPDRCLTVGEDKQLTIESCGYSLNQKWFWEGEGDEQKLISRYVDDTNQRYVLNIVEGNTVGVTPEEQATKAYWKPILQKIKLQ